MFMFIRTLPFVFLELQKTSFIEQVKRDIEKIDSIDFFFAWTKVLCFEGLP